MKCDRRDFVKGTIGAAVAAGMGGCSQAALTAGAPGPVRQPKSIRLGGPIFVKSDDPQELATEHRKLGYRAAYCPNVPLNDSARIRAIAEAFAKNDVVIAEVGRWCNLLDADPDKRRANLKNVTDGLALAEAIGARCCVDVAGSFSTESWFGPHPDNLSPRFSDAVVENARKIIDAVNPQRAKFCYEMVGWSLPDSPDAYLKLIKAVDRPAFAVHVDVCNLINCPTRFYHSTEVINECFDKLGKYIISCHAKDLVWDVEMNVHFREVPVGKGKVDWSTHLKRLATQGHDATLMIEHCANPEEFDQARQYLLGLGPKAGVSFG